MTHAVRTALTPNPVFLPLWVTFKLQGQVTELSCSKGPSIRSRERTESFHVFYLGKYLLVLDDVFIGGQQHIELPAAQLWHKSAAQAGSSLEAEQREMCFCAC